MRTRLIPVTLLSSLLLLQPTSVTGGILPEAPPPGLRLSLSVSCDFQDRWWELTFYPETTLPLEVRWRRPGMATGRVHDLTRDLNASRQRELYDLARAAFGEFRLDRPPPLLGDGTAGAWMGPRTLTLSGQILDGQLGRVDRVDLAMNLIQGRPLPPNTEALVAAFARHARPVTLDLDCR